MKLRIYRSYAWELACSPMEVRYGGDNPMKLVSHDELQYFHDSDGWIPVDIFECEKPKHPKEVQREKKHVRISEGMKDIFKNAKQGHFAVGIQRHGEPSKCICGGIILDNKCENDK